MENMDIAQLNHATITSKEFAAKASSKKEIYQLLCQNAGAYLPQPTLITIYFLKDLTSGKRLFHKHERVKHLYVPYYDSLSINVLMDWGVDNFPQIARYFPEAREQVKLPRQWCINVLYSGIGDDFAKFIKSKCEERNQKIYVKKDLSIAIDPAVLAAFNSSSLTSVGKSATGASLLKIGSKRKRTKREIEDDKVNKIQKEQEIADKFANIQQMQEQMEQMQAQIEQNQNNTDLINNLVNQGAASFDENGVFNIQQE